MSILIVGAKATGKHLMFDILRASPLECAINFQSAPLSDLDRFKTADRYLITDRRLADRSLHRRHEGRVPLAECTAMIEHGRRQVAELVEGKDSRTIHYRQLVECTNETVEVVAQWLNIEPWPVPYDIHDGDTGL